MTTLLHGVRRGDAVLAVLLTGLGIVLMVADLTSTDASLRQDSSSGLLVPVFVAATLPVLWRRRNILLVIGVSCAAMAVHLLAFGWTVRCGAGLPLAFALAYGAGRLAPRAQALIGLLGTVVLQVLVLANDSAAGWGILPVTIVISAAFWGVGAWLRSRAAQTTEAGTPVPVGSLA